MAQVLIVDDEVEVCDFLSESLSDDYDTRTATTGKEVILFFEEQSPDVMIVDIVMSGIDGVSLVEHLKLQYADSHTQYILLSGHMSADYMKRWIELFPEPIFFSKPVSISTLRRAVSSLLQ